MICDSEKLKPYWSCLSESTSLEDAPTMLRKVASRSPLNAAYFLSSNLTCMSGFDDSIIVISNLN